MKKLGIILLFASHLGIIGCGGSSAPVAQNANPVNPAPQTKLPAPRLAGPFDALPVGALAISSVADFLKMKDDPSAYYYLTADIDFQNQSPEMIAEFTGTLDGRGWAILNLKIEPKGTASSNFFGTATPVTNIYKVGLFLVLKGAVKNIVFDHASISLDACTNVDGCVVGGGVVADTVSRGAFIDNVHLDGGTLAGHRVGSVARQLDGTIQNSSSSAALEVRVVPLANGLAAQGVDAPSIGGLTQTIKSGARILKSSFTGSLTTEATVLGRIEPIATMGGVVGVAAPEALTFGNPEIDQVSVDTTIKSSFYMGRGQAGGVVGACSGATTISNSRVVANIDVLISGGLIGGIGNFIPAWPVLNSKFRLFQNSVRVNIATAPFLFGNVGGLIGAATNMWNIEIQDNEITGFIDGTNTGAAIGSGGVIGFLLLTPPASPTVIGIKNTLVRATISTNYKRGGIIGLIEVSPAVAALLSTVTATDTYWDSTVAGFTTDTTVQSAQYAETGTLAVGQAKTTTQLQSASNYATWNASIWNIIDGQAPVLR